MKKAVSSVLFMVLTAVILVLSGCPASGTNSGPGGGSGSTFTVNGTVLSNVFGKSLGVVLVTMDSTTTVMIGSNSSAATSNTDFTFTVTVPSISTGFAYYGLYDDINGNGYYDAKDSILFNAYAYTSSSSAVYDLELVGKVLNGTISGADAALFTNIQVWGTVVNYSSPVTAGNFSLTYYVKKDYSGSNSVTLWMDKDGDNNYGDNNEPRIGYTNQIYLPGNVISTNTVSFSIQKYTNWYVIDTNSDDKANFKFLDGSQVMGTSMTNYSYKYSGASNTGSYEVYILNDADQDGIKDSSEFYLNKSISVSNQTGLTNSLVVKRMEITVYIAGNYFAYANPRVYLWSSTSSFLGLPVTANPMVLTNYCVTDWGAYTRIYIFNDLDNNGNDFGDMERISYDDYTISTYSPTYLASLSVTN